MQDKNMVCCERCGESELFDVLNFFCFKCGYSGFADLNKKDVVNNANDKHTKKGKTLKIGKIKSFKSKRRER